MRILLIAPQPFYQERGTPIAVDLLLRVLSARGDEVHVATFHEGTDVNYPGVTLHRIKPPPLARGVPPGFSLKKILCDAALFFLVLQLVRKVRPQIVHAVEEAVFFGWHAKFWSGIPYIYDMDSSLARQLVETKPLLRGLGKVFQGLENAACRHALMVIPVCDALADIARAAGAPRITLLRDISLLDRWGGEAEPDLRATLGLRGPIFMYVGNLEKYQGLDLLLDSWALATKKNSAMSLVIVGGTPAHIEKYRRRVEELGLATRVHFLGPRPVSRLASLLAQADVLLSPRTTGNNTPMKIYSYLDAGKAVLATDLPTHTQVLTPEIAYLAPAEPVAFSAALARLADHAALRVQLGAAAKGAARAKYSFVVFQQTLRAAYAEIESFIINKEKK